MNSQSPVRTAGDNPVSLTYTVIVNADYTWQCFIGSKPVKREKLPPDDIFHIPSITTRADIQLLLRTLQQYKICAGNSDKNFVGMVLSKKGVISLEKIPQIHLVLLIAVSAFMISKFIQVQFVLVIVTY